MANYSRVSGRLQVQDVVDMFQQSLLKYNVCLKYYLADGDSVVTAETYGPDFSVEKLQCVGHIQKCMGICLGN